MTGPLLVVLHLIPQGVLAGLFFIMGVQALEANGITLKILFLLKDHTLTPSATEPLKRIRRKQAIYYFVALELLGFGATFAITQTIAAIGFPIIILLLIPVRTFLLPRYFTQEELSILDAPTASPFTMESVGGNFGEDVSEMSTPVGGVHGGSATGSREGADEFFAAGVDDTSDSLERGEALSQSKSMSYRRTSFRDDETNRDRGARGESIEMQRPGMSRRGKSREAS